MAEEQKTVNLVASDGESFEVALDTAMLSNLIMMMDDGGDGDLDDVPLPNVNADILTKVIAFMTEYKREKMNEIAKPLVSENMSQVVQTWYADFVTGLEQDTLFELILAANFMDIKPLLDLTCATVASMIKGKTPEDIRKHFNIVDDFTPEGEATVREENKWCEEE